MASFTKLLDAVGPPPDPAADPPARLPPLDPLAPGAAEAQTLVPTWQEMGFQDAPLTIFKVRHLTAGSLLSAHETS